jgi:hypothetical protein
LTGKEAVMSYRLSVDRFEGREKEIAVLVGEDDVVLNVPRALLPADVGAGDIVTLTLARDAEAIEAVAAEARELTAELKARDPNPGGDVSL